MWIASFIDVCIIKSLAIKLSDINLDKIYIY